MFDAPLLALLPLQQSNLRRHRTRQLQGTRKKLAEIKSPAEAGQGLSGTKMKMCAVLLEDELPSDFDRLIALRDDCFAAR
jgi:hypothetical protein